MFFLKPLALCEQFIGKLNQSLMKLGGKKLSCSQMVWLSVCITGIIVTNSVCWEKFHRATLGKFRAGNFSKLFRRAKISWNSLLIASVKIVLDQYNIKEGILALDGTDNHRSQNTKKIANIHKIKDKKSGGFIKGQELTMLVLITGTITIPVGFAFYQPDPAYTLWKTNEKRLKKAGIKKKDRPKQPEKNVNFPSMLESALRLLQEFADNFPEIRVQAILADALYGVKTFVTPASKIFSGVQVISQAKKTQLVKFRGKYISISRYFSQNKAVPKKIKIRGADEQEVTVNGARLYLKAHGCKRFIIALSYAGEEEFRYLLASDLTWRLTDIVSAYTLRWLVEVFIQDWKSYEGWCQLAKHIGDEGSCRGVILSLLVDHTFLLHPDQIALINNKLPASTVGSLRDRERANAIVEAIEDIVGDVPSTSEVIEKLRSCVNDAIPMRRSSKHMSGRDLGRLEPTNSLKHLAAA